MKKLQKYKVTPYEVKDNVALFENMAKDVSPKQFLRELIQNALEAQAENILITTAPDYPYVRKMMFVDDGCGMSEQQLEEYMGHLSSGAKERGKQHNYGLGGTISTAVQNPLGVRYDSWVSLDDGTELVGCKDEESDSYGPKQIYDEEEGWMLTGEPSIDPHQLIQNAGHGTCVTLLGEHEEEDTIRKHDPSAIRWAISWLNQRYLTFPDNVSIKWKAKSDKGVWDSKPIYGRKHYLDERSEARGVVKLTGAKAHWWLYKENINADPAFSQVAQFGILYKNEIYNISDKRMLRVCGVITVSSRACIYIEPDDVQPDLAREHLKTTQGGELPIENWQDEFAQNLPEEIKKAEDEAGKNSKVELSIDDIRGYLSKQNEKLPFAPTRGGSGTSSGGGTGGNTGSGTKESSGTGTGTGTGGTGSGDGRGDGRGDGDGSGVNTQPKQRRKKSIDVIWDTVNALNDRAAEYLPRGRNGPTILLNKKYYLYSMIAKAAIVSRRSIDDEYLWGVIQKHAALRVCLVVEAMKVLSFGDSEWADVNTRNKALEQEALTSAIEGSRLDILKAVNTEISNKVGKKRDNVVRLAINC